MSTTQQEIATPKACNQRKRLIILISLALFFVDAAAVCIVLFHDNAVAVMFTLIVLMLAEAAVAIWFFRHNLFAVKIILNVLTNCFALTLILRLIVTMTEANKATNIIYIATVAAMAILLICLDIVGSKHTSRRTTRYLTYTATFVALSVLFKMLGNTISSIVIIPNMRLSFVYVPWVLSGFVLGPVGGVITALISDILGQLTVAVGGAINPLTTLSNALFPLAPALIFKLFKGKMPDWISLLVGMVLSLIFCTMGIGAYALFSYYNYGSSMSFWTYLLTIRSPQIIIIAINYFLCLLLLPTVKKMKLSDKLQQE
ncbi:MAG: folate family ECF transporter S component [Clostridia bacterium]|nr:folate family ECF transporter S component [Clostridia bacterium]